ncbi:interferon gamma isoform 2-T2 [Clarias gariepinus]|uniref:interferon gamma 1 isoform X2 n=1 Tax=Clarias gariepinus TaxID=13013 RepID=UPI00234D8A37|nr:interferon gamma 1 isoform X2 [Clarias gariepinus]
MMTFFWRICFVLFGMMSYSEAFLPENIKTSYDHLIKHYNPNKNEVYNGHPLFGKLNDKNLEVAEQKLLMTIVLDAYNRILGQMETEAQDEKVKHDLHEVKEQMNKLKEHYFSGKHADIRKYVTELLELKENETKIQNKAIHELGNVYNKASILGSSETHRRRRHTKGSKKQRS